MALISQCHFAFKKCAWRDSNAQSSAPEADALSIKLRAQILNHKL